MSDDRDAQVRQTARASATTLGAKVPALRVALPGLPELFMREHDRSPLLANAGDRVGLEGTTVAGPPTLYSGEVVLRFDDGAVGIRFGEGDGRNGEFLGVLEKLPKANDGYVITEAAPWEKTYEAPTPRLADVARDVFRRLAPPDAVLEMDPLDLAALNAVAESRQRSGEVDDAVVMWLRAENLVKDGTHAALAVDALVFAKHIDDALALAQEYAATSPACAVRAAELLASAGHTERASAAFDAVLATPDESNSELNERAQNGKARLLFARGDVEGAAALATNPDLRADALVALGKVNEAITLLKLTAARRPHAEKKRLEARAFELECKKAILLRRKPSSAL